MVGLTPHLDVADERRIEESLERRGRKLDRRERLGTLLFAGAFLALALALAVLGEPARELSPLLAPAFVVAFAVAGRIEFSTGAGYAVPTQLVFLPMLLLLPTSVVPLLVALALVASSAWDAWRGGTARSRSLLA